MILMKKLRLLAFYLLTITILGACKDDPQVIDTAHMSEEDIYYADYDAPEYRWGYLDESGKLAIADKFDNTRDFSEGLAATNLKGKWGYINTSGKTVIQHNYRSAFPFKDGIARIQNFDKLYGFINKDGEKILEPQFVEAYDLQDGLIKIKTSRGYNFIDIKGDTLLSTPISKVNNFESGYAIVKDFGKEALLDTNGKLVIDYDYDKIYRPEGDIIRVKSDKKVGAITLNKHIKIPIEYDKLTKFQNNVAAAKKNNKWTLISKDNTVLTILPSEIKNVVAMNEDRWMVYNGEKFAITDLEGNLISDYNFDALNKFHESIAVYEQDGAYGYLDIDGNTITGPDFPLCWDFVGDKARAIFNRGVGFLNKQGKPVIPAIFFEVRDFHDGLSRVQIYR